MADHPHGDPRRMSTLVAIMKALRTPGTGCPWDLEQSFSSIAPYTIEEAYEVADAIEQGDMAGLRDELGDLLLQVVYHAQMASEDGTFALEDVIESVCTKMVRRHPHVFGDAEERDAGAVKGSWERIKSQERAAKHSGGNGRESVLDGIPRALPALMRAEKLQKRAARVGFDWPDADAVFLKIDEEVQELRDEMAAGNRQRMAEECGDLIFAVSNIARHLGIDPEDALRQANSKFDRRFRAVEACLHEDGKRPEDSCLEEMDALWDGVKAQERSG